MCKGVDEAGNLTDAANAKNVTWTKDTVGPTNSDITLSGLPDPEDSSGNLSVTVSGAGVATYKYVFKANGDPCTQEDFDAQTWTATSASIEGSIGTDGNKRLCVIGRDSVLNETPLADAKIWTWEKDTVAPAPNEIILTGAPDDPTSSTASLDVTVSGDDVLFYQFSYTTSAETCEDAVYNGSWTAVTTHIQVATGNCESKKGIDVEILS